MDYITSMSVHCAIDAELNHATQFVIESNDTKSVPGQFFDWASKSLKGMSSVISKVASTVKSNINKAKQYKNEDIGYESIQPPFASKKKAKELISSLNTELKNISEMVDHIYSISTNLRSLKLDNEDDVSFNMDPIQDYAQQFYGMIEKYNKSSHSNITKTWDLIKKLSSDRQVISYILSHNTNDIISICGQLERVSSNLNKASDNLSNVTVRLNKISEDSSNMVKGAKALISAMHSVINLLKSDIEAYLKALSSFIS